MATLHRELSPQLLQGLPLKDIKCAKPTPKDTLGVQKYIKSYIENSLFDVNEELLHIISLLA